MLQPSTVIQGNGDIMIDHVALGFIASYLIEYLKKLPWFPMRVNTDNLNKFVSVVFAFCSSIGILFSAQGSWLEGWKIGIDVPSLAILGTTFMHTIGQVAIQQVVYKGAIKKDPIIATTILAASADGKQQVQGISITSGH